MDENGNGGDRTSFILNVEPIPPLYFDYLVEGEEREKLIIS